MCTMWRGFSLLSLNTQKFIDYSTVLVLKDAATKAATKSTRSHKGGAVRR
jgi:hypothetical protein